MVIDNIIMDEYKHLDVSTDNDVFRIAFDRPDLDNAVNKKLHKELTYVFKDAYDSDTRVVVLTGHGESFVAGADQGYLEELRDNPDVFRPTMRQGEEIIEDMLNLEKPIVARVNGDAVGLGATLALTCDIVIASDDATIMDPHVPGLALPAGDGGCVMWPLRIGFGQAKEYLLTGTPIPADEAEEMGLINYSIPSDELDAKVDEMVTTLASEPQLAVRYTKQTLNQWVQLGMNNMFGQGFALEALAAYHDDFEEAMEAFLEGREPEFPSARGGDD
jgi:enoyl-CoA hydratase